MRTVTQVTMQAGLAEVAKQVARGLAKADLLQGRAFIRTPVLFPSGSTVVVVLEEDGSGRYRLSDLGQGFEEADQVGMADTYRRQAAPVAALSGIDFAGNAFVLAGITVRQLDGGTMTVANAAARAVERTLLRTGQRPEPATVERLVLRLTRLFPGANVTRAAELRGASEHPWSVDAVVAVGSHRAVFDIVTPSPVSVAFANTKFHDFARLEPPPKRVAVVHRKADFGDLLSVIAQAASIIEDDAPDRTFVRAAELAHAA
jgi:hypothetical protein